MPRGVATPEPRQQLFAALEQVIADGGPGRLTSRAVTRAAGVATGLLYAHFANFDDLLAGYAVDRAFQISGEVAGLPSRAGTGTVIENLTEALLATPPDTLAAVTRLLACRPELASSVHTVLGEGAAGLAAVEHAVADYLAAEQALGRVPSDVDTDALALTAVSVLHHVALTGDVGTTDDRIRRAVAALTRRFPAVTQT